MGDPMLAIGYDGYEKAPGNDIRRPISVNGRLSQTRLDWPFDRAKSVSEAGNKRL
ncbi:MAG: hypothetical protein ACI814_004551 [Mariniblastus sp.]|jgi:hypothetical protein